MDHPPFAEVESTRAEARALFERLVPASGQARTVQGELVRSLFRLHREAMVNGNGNWDDGFRRMHAYLRRHLLDRHLFSSDQLKAIKADLGRTRSGRSPCLDDDIWARLRHAVVLWCRAHPVAIPHATDPDVHR
jgi:hypothetical protein